VSLTYYRTRGFGQTPAFYSCIPTGMHGPTGIFWANLLARLSRWCARRPSLGAARRRTLVRIRSTRPRPRSTGRPRRQRRPRRPSATAGAGAGLGSRGGVRALARRPLSLGARPRWDPSPRKPPCAGSLCLSGVSEAASVWRVCVSVCVCLTLFLSVVPTPPGYRGSDIVLCGMER
jgi:hypothetical protein